MNANHPNYIFINRRQLPLSFPVLALALMTAFTPCRLRAVTAEEFGYGNMKVSGLSVSGHIPLLVILYQIPTTVATLWPSPTIPITTTAYL
jgi:hypothetical protein